MYPPAFFELSLDYGGDECGGWTQQNPELLRTQASGHTCEGVFMWS